MSYVITAAVAFALGAGWGWEKHASMVGRIFHGGKK